MGVPGVLDAGEPVRRSSPQLRGHQFSEPSSMRLRSKAARKGWTIFPTMPRRWPHWAWTPRPARNVASSCLGTLNAIYQSKRPDPNAIADTRNRYEATRKDESAADTLRNIADYFVRSDADPETYLGKNSSNFSIGALAGAECEREFAARFDVRDILDAYNAVPGLHPIGRNTLVRLMGALVGGWPEGMDEHLTVRLSGRIDRMETRVLADGGECIRLIDYKTGRRPRSNRFSMICSSCAISLASCSPKTGRAVPSTCRNAAYQPKRAIPCRAECGTSQKLRSGRCLPAAAVH